VSHSVARWHVLSLTRDSVSVSQSVSRSLVCFVVNTWQCLSQSVSQSLGDVFFGDKHVIMSQSVSQSVAHWCVLPLTRDSVPVSQRVSQSLFYVFCRWHVIVCEAVSLLQSVWELRSAHNYMELWSVTCDVDMCVLMMSFLKSTSVSQPVFHSFGDVFRCRHLILCHSASQSVALLCALSSTRDNVSVSQSVCSLLMCFLVLNTS